MPGVAHVGVTMENKPPIFLRMVHIHSQSMISIAMTGGWFMALLYPHEMGYGMAIPEES